MLEFHILPLGIHRKVTHVHYEDMHEAYIYIYLYAYKLYTRGGERQRKEARLDYLKIDMHVHATKGTYGGIHNSLSPEDMN